MSDSRYQYSEVIKSRIKFEQGAEKEGLRTFETTLMPKIPESEEDIYIYTREGDRLDLLAQEYYNNSEYWWILAQANNIKGSWVLEPGKRFRIPPSVDEVLELLQLYNQSR